MTRKFQKKYSTPDIYIEEIELEEDEMEGLTEEEIFELADERLWDKAFDTVGFEIEDDIMDYPEEIQ